MKKSLLPVLLLAFSSLSLIAMDTPAKQQEKKMKQQEAFRQYTGESSNDFFSEQSSPVNSAKSTPASSPVDSNFARFMRSLKRQSK